MPERRATTGSLEQFDKLTATFAPRRTDDLKPYGPPIGWRGEFEAYWIIEDGPYAGEWAMMAPRSGYTSLGTEWRLNRMWSEPR